MRMSTGYKSLILKSNIKTSTSPQTLLHKDSQRAPYHVLQPEKMHCILNQYKNTV